MKAEEAQMEPDTKVYVCPKCKAELRISNEACASCGLSMKVNSSGSLWIDGAIFPDHDHQEALKAFGVGDFDYYNRDEQINKRFIDDFWFRFLSVCTAVQTNANLEYCRSDAA